MSSAKQIFSKSSFAAALLFFTSFSIAPSQATLFGSGSCQSDVTSTSGVTVVTSGNYCYIAFASTGANSWKAPAGITSFDAVIVAGGGAGGAGAWGGGGGAGGVVLYNGYSVTPGTVINLSVGAGGTPGGDNLTPSTNRSNNGDNSWIVSASGVVAIGGGAGASYAYNSSTGSYVAGSGGGSGGGGTEDYDNTRNSGGSSTQTLPSGATAKYGFGGGAGGTTTTRSGGGGGGAGGAGGNAASSIGGNGGAGTNALSAFLTVFPTPFGVSGYIAGGGAGGSANGTQATGGSGGGGNGGYNGSNPGISGTTNTGSGGGGSTYSGNTTAGSGGSGLIILRFAADTTAPSFTSGTTFSSPENTAITVAAATIKVSESATVTISSGVDASLFTVSNSDTVTALIKFKISPNYEAPSDSGGNNVYDLVLSATDPSGNIGTQTISITVTNVNEAPTIGAFSSAATASYSVAENTSALFNLNATDVDSGTTFTYSLTGTDAGDFAISGSGLLSFSPAPDYENPQDSDLNNVYIVVAWVSDGALSDSQTVSVTVTNVNEAVVIGNPTVSGTLFKGVSASITVTLNAPGKVRFFMDGKRISTCLSVATTGSNSSFSAVCNFKPSVTNRHSFYATLTPSDISFTGTTSPNLWVYVVKRATTR
jgi:VCBS repeat-containing protein